MRLASDQWVAAFEALPRGRSLWLQGLGLSMRPLLASGDRLLVERCDEGELHPGDIALGITVHGLTAHVVRSVSPLITASIRGLQDAVPMRVLGRVTKLERSGRQVPINAITRTALDAVTGAAAYVRRAPWVVEQLRLARDATNGPATMFLRKRMLGDVGVRRLEPADREATLLFLGDHVPDLIEYGNKQFNARWQNEGRAFGAFGKRGMCGFVYIDEYRHEGAPLEGFWIRALLVAPIGRGMGLGKRLVEATVEFGRARQLQEIFADVREENEPSRRLFEGAGFVADPALTRTLNDQRREGPMRGWWIGYRRGL